MDSRADVISKVKALVATRFSGSYFNAYYAYCKPSAFPTVASQGVDSTGVNTLLYDAGVGSIVTRKLFYVSEVMKELDMNSDGFIAWSEFNTALNGA